MGQLTEDRSTRDDGRFHDVARGEMSPTTKARRRRRAPGLGAFGAAGVSLTLVLITATSLLPIRPATADQVSDLKAQATQIAQDLVLEQLQIGTDQQQYAVDVAAVQRDQAAISSSQNRIQADVDRVNGDRRRLQSEALSAYIHSDQGSDGVAVLFEGTQNDAGARVQYEDIASGDVTLSMDALRTDENELRAQRATLERQQARDQSTTDQEAALANAARQTELQLTSKQSEITGQLAVAVAQQQAAQASAAAAAVRTAQAAAAPPTSPATSRTTTSTGQPSPPARTTVPPGSVAGSTSGSSSGSSPSDPSLPAYLQCVLQAESGGNYAAVSPGGTYMGGFQFSQATWNEAAQLAGMPQLSNVPPNEATPAEQDDLAIALYEADGQQPWTDSCRTS